MLRGYNSERVEFDFSIQLKDSRKKRQSIKNRIASIETGDWRFSSDEDEDAPAFNQPQQVRPTEEVQVVNLAVEPQTTKVMSPSIVEENFSVKDLRSAWELNIEHQRSDNPASSLSSLINRTEVAFNEVEATFQAVENKMDQALLHTEKLIDNSRQVISSDSTVDDSNTEEASEKDPEDEDSILSDAKTGETNTPSNITTPVTDNPPNELYSRNIIEYILKA